MPNRDRESGTYGENIEAFWQDPKERIEGRYLELPVY
jgi:hypothetical protein